MHDPTKRAVREHEIFMSNQEASETSNKIKLLLQKSTDNVQIDDSLGWLRELLSKLDESTTDLNNTLVRSGTIRLLLKDKFSRVMGKFSQENNLGSEFEKQFNELYDFKYSVFTVEEALVLHEAIDAIKQACKKMDALREMLESISKGEKAILLEQEDTK